MNLTPEAKEAYDAGVLNGTISDSIESIIRIVQEQDVVSYCSVNGSYTFDYMDVDYTCGALMR